MKKSVIIIIALIAVIGIMAFWMVNIYNKMVVADETVGENWSNVETQYQRRTDLIPNLVSTVKGYAAHEQETLDAVVSARAKATQVTVDAENMTPEKMAEYQEAQGEIGSALGKLMMITENYPDLKADKQFIALQEQLEGTENRIATARKNFNAVAKTYNTMIRRFPNSMLAGMFGFEKRAYFEAQAGAEKAVQVEF